MSSLEGMQENMEVDTQVLYCCVRDGARDKNSEVK
jgi:hypothetical protein